MECVNVGNTLHTHSMPFVGFVNKLNMNILSSLHVVDLIQVNSSELDLQHVGNLVYSYLVCSQTQQNGMECGEYPT